MAFPVAAIQLEIEPGEPAENLERALHFIREAAAGGARLMLLPEACLSDIFRGAQDLAEPIPGPALSAVASAAGDATVAFPLIEKSSDESVYSSCAIITRDRILGVARKTHLFRDLSGSELFQDSEVVAAGGELSVISIGETKIGVLIGFDCEFPEAFRTLALRGADIILCALNSAETDLEFLRSMARCNCVPVVAANRLGFRRIYPSTPEQSATQRSIVQDARGSFLQRCKGGSVVIDGCGNTLDQAGGSIQLDSAAPDAPLGMQIPNSHFQDEKILTASFRIEELRLQKLTSPFFGQRRPELYER